MSEPTEKQFEQATNHGIEYALQEIANGATEPRESPLSGEWADDITVTQVAGNVGYSAYDDEDESAFDELADAWETGYNDTWQSHLEVEDTMDFDQIAEKQGWNNDSLLFITRDFIATRGMNEELAVFARERARAENSA